MKIKAGDMLIDPPGSYHDYTRVFIYTEQNGEKYWFNTDLGQLVDATIENVEDFKIGTFYRKGIRIN